VQNKKKKRTQTLERIDETQGMSVPRSPPRGLPNDEI
jgi:hypothetical protein